MGWMWLEEFPGACFGFVNRPGVLLPQPQKEVLQARDFPPSRRGCVERQVEMRAARPSCQAQLTYNTPSLCSLAPSCPRMKVSLLIPLLQGPGPSCHCHTAARCKWPTAPVGSVAPAASRPVPVPTCKCVGRGLGHTAPVTLSGKVLASLSCSTTSTPGRSAVEE